MKDIKKITKEDIDNICEKVAEGIAIECAANLYLYDAADYRKLMLKGKHPKTPEIAKHCYDKTTWSEARAEEKFTRQWLSGAKGRSQAAESYLQTVKPRFQKRFKLNVQYEVEILMDAVKKHVTQDVYESILADLAALDNVQVIGAYDERILPDANSRV